MNSNWLTFEKVAVYGKPSSKTELTDRVVPGSVSNLVLQNNFASDSKYTITNDKVFHKV